MGAFTRTARTAHVIARQPCIVLKLDLKVLERQSPPLRLKIYQVFIETLIVRLEKTTKRLSEQTVPLPPKNKNLSTTAQIHFSNTGTVSEVNE